MTTTSGDDFLERRASRPSRRTGTPPLHLTFRTTTIRTAKYSHRKQQGVNDKAKRCNVSLWQTPTDRARRGNSSSRWLLFSTNRGRLGI